MEFYYIDINEDVLDELSHFYVVVDLLFSPFHTPLLDDHCCLYEWLFKLGRHAGEHE